MSPSHILLVVVGVGVVVVVVPAEEIYDRFTHLLNKSHPFVCILQENNLEIYFSWFDSNTAKV